MTEPGDPEETPDTDSERSGPLSVREMVARIEPDAPSTEPSAPAPVRRFTVNGEEWVARLAGEAIYGSGQTATARLDAIRFFRAGEMNDPAREILLAHNRFDNLYDEELREIFARARDISDAR